MSNVQGMLAELNLHGMLVGSNKPDKCEDCRKKTDKLSVAETMHWNGFKADWDYQHKYLCPECLYDHNKKQENIVYAL